MVNKFKNLKDNKLGCSGLFDVCLVGLVDAVS